MRIIDLEINIRTSTNNPEYTGCSYNTLANIYNVDALLCEKTTCLMCGQQEVKDVLNRANYSG